MIFFVQHAKEVVSNSPGWVDFAIGLMNSALNLLNGQMAWKWSLLGNSSYKGTIINVYQNFLWIHVIDMTSGKYMLATASPNGKVKLLFFARDVIKRWGPRISPSYYECGPWLLSKECRRKTEPKETLSCMISHQLVVFTQQLEILVTTLLCTLLWSLI